MKPSPHNVYYALRHLEEQSLSSLYSSCYILQLFRHQLFYRPNTTLHLLHSLFLHCSLPHYVSAASFQVQLHINLCSRLSTYQYLYHSCHYTCNIQTDAPMPELLHLLLRIFRLPLYMTLKYSAPEITTSFFF